MLPTTGLHRTDHSRPSGTPEILRTGQHCCDRHCPGKSGGFEELLLRCWVWVLKEEFMRGIKSAVTFSTMLACVAAVGTQQSKSQTPPDQSLAVNTEDRKSTRLNSSH